MINENGVDRAKLKGYIFEVVILRLLKTNNFDIVTDYDNKKIKKERSNFIEIRGRGCWHQIDCPCDYNHFIPFINPIRLLGEVKFQKNPINKTHIEEFIGTIKDISENYFIPEDYKGPYERNTEIGVYFSANGFDDESEKLAFAHNIKTVSYKNNAILRQIKILIEELERNYLEAKKCISSGNLTDFMDKLLYLFENNYSIYDFIDKFKPSDGFINIIEIFKESMLEIKDNFIASTSGGAFIHFIADKIFPDNLFYERDTRECRIYYEGKFSKPYFYLKIEGDNDKDRKFYFTPPTSLERAVYYGKKAVLYEKEIIFKTLHFNKVINGMNRNLILDIDKDWLESQRED